MSAGELLVLVPERGDPVALPRAAWEATVDFLAERQAFHQTLLDAWRQAPGVTVSDLQATRMAGLADQEAEEPGTDATDRIGLERLAEFCRESGGFLVAGPEALADTAIAEPSAPDFPPAPIAPPEPPRWHGRAKRLLGPFAILLIFSFKWLAKLKILLVALPKIGLLKTALLGLTNLWFYALFWGWRIAALVIVLLLIHEAGHAIAFRAFGLGVARIGFTPFIGAYAMSKRAASSAWVGAMCALAGPFIGGLGCLALWVYGHTQGSDLASAAAALGFLLNLFNLVPVVPFDGGAAAAAIHPYIWVVGVIALTGLALAFPNIIMWLFVAIALWQAWKMLKHYRSGDEEALLYYRSVTTSQRIIVVVLYFGLAALLAIGMVEAMPPRPGR